MKVLKKFLSITLCVLIFCNIFALSACGNDNPESTMQSTGDSTVEEPIVYPDTPSSAYVHKYGDFNAMDEWLKENVTDTEKPPVTLNVGEKTSDQLEWEKVVGIETSVQDFAEDNPQTRRSRVITYTCEQESLEIQLTLTSYSNYPVVEYSATLYNIATENSSQISNLLSFDYSVESNDGYKELHINKGSTCSYDDFHPYTYTLDQSLSFSSTTGKPTYEYMPYFNIANAENNTGTIAILDWQGNWKAQFTPEGNDVILEAGQYETNLVLQQGENMRFPGAVMLFYKGDFMNGQNVYRRWFYNCNQFREQGSKMQSTNVLIGSTSTSETGDLANIQTYIDAGLTEYIDKFNIDAGWYQNGGKSWIYTGNYYPSTKYPNGLKPISDAAHEAGLDLALWYEPERIIAGTTMAQDLAGNIIAVDNYGYAKNNPNNGEEVVINYSDPTVVDYVVDMLVNSIKENGVDQYRQDFNIHPAPHWAAWDKSTGRKLKIDRVGYTENHYCTGYLEVFDRIVDQLGIYIDACASGGMRNDLSTMRYSFMHTRSDNWADIESSQLQTYGASMWFMYWGTGFSSTDFNSYDVRSHIGNSIGVGITNNSQAPLLKNALIEWKHLAEYLFWDYYPLTDYAGSSNKTMALQYDSPEEGKGMCISYFRKGDEFLLQPRGLAPDATYRIWDMDDKNGTIKTMTGREIMDGITINAPAQSAIVYEYELTEGSDTSAFQSESVPTGDDYTGFVPPVPPVVKPEAIAPSVTAIYKPNGLTDEDLKALYTITEDNVISYLTTDYRSSGTIYQISQDVYDSIKTVEGTISGWEIVDKSAMYIRLLPIDPVTDYPFTQWDAGAFRQQPLIKKIDDTYFLWFTASVPLSDAGGGWSDMNVLLSWDTKDGNRASTTFEFITNPGLHKMTYHGVDSYDGNGIIFKITEDMFGSFAYTGYGIEVGETMWFEIDPEKCGVATSWYTVPLEDSNVLDSTTFLTDTGDDKVGIYTFKDGDNYYLWIKESSSLPLDGGRAVFVWYDKDGKLCQQTFLMS